MQIQATTKNMCCYQHAPTRFSAYCAIFTENFIVCSKLLLYCVGADVKSDYTWV